MMSHSESDEEKQATQAVTQEQVSAGGVAIRQSANGWEAALILTEGKAGARWQLPKGLVDAGETPEQAALREVREEAGIVTEIVKPLDTVEYWYWSEQRGQRIRFHKRVHFFLLAYVSGDVADHDHEVLEARWFPLEEAITRLAFAGEKAAAQQAKAHFVPGSLEPAQTTLPIL